MKIWSELHGDMQAQFGLVIALLSQNDPSEIPCRASEMRARTGLYRWSPNGDVRSREGGTEGSRFV
jgi:hypothetical protein